MHRIVILVLILPVFVFPQGVGVGTRIDLSSGLQLASGQFAQLFIPDYYSPPSDGKYTLVFHFHSASWAAENEVYRATANAVLFNIHLGSFSSPYQNYFTDQSKFQKILDTVNTRLIRHNIIPNAVLHHLILTSFSAGYAGVREVLKSQGYYDKIDALTLADGLHSSSDASMHTQMKDFVRFAKDARDGLKIFLLTHSSITTTGYQNTTQTANYLIDSIGSHRISFTGFDEIGTQYSRCDTGNFHLKGYYGITADDHLKHLYAMYLMTGRVMNQLVDIKVENPAFYPEGYFLLQNYPNPFNPATTITFGIPETADVSLNIYSVTGELVKNLVNDIRPPGIYKVNFDGYGLPSGIYIYRITAGIYSENKKMLLLK